MIRVVIVEDQTIVREGLRSVLSLVGDIEIAGEAADGEEALDVIARTGPDVVLLDLRMPKLDGVGVLKRLSANGGKVPPTLILTTFDDDTALFDAVRAGAKGFLLKDVSLDRLTRTVHDVAAGRTVLEPAVTERIIRAVESNPPSFEASEIIDPLTGREAAILRLLAGGYNNREIGELLNLGEGTIKNHISNVLSKLGVRDRTRAVLKAIDLGLI